MPTTMPSADHANKGFGAILSAGCPQSRGELGRGELTDDLPSSKSWVGVEGPPGLGTPSQDPPGQDPAADGWAEQGLWRCGGDQLPNALLEALCGRVAWADPNWLGDEALGPRRSADADGADGDSPNARGASPDDGDGLGELGLEVGFCQGGVLDGLGPGPELALL